MELLGKYLAVMHPKEGYVLVSALALNAVKNNRTAAAAAVATDSQAECTDFKGDAIASEGTTPIPKPTTTTSHHAPTHNAECMPTAT